MTDKIQESAERLRIAGETHRPCAPIRDLIDPIDVKSAYAAQEINTQLWLKRGRRLIGRKIGLTSEAVQKQLGVDQPDFGMLFDDMLVAEDRAIPFAQLMQPKIEGEIALVLKKPLNRERHTIADVVAATDYVSPALEIVGSRIANWDIRLADTIADNASSSHFVLGTQKLSLDSVDLPACTMVMEKKGVQVSSGTGKACMGNPLNAAVWLADTMVRMGRPLAAGDIVMTGALGPMVVIEPGDIVRAKMGGLGEVQAIFGDKQG